MATFHSVSQALRFEKLALAQGVAVKLIPVPRIISSSCGIAARFAAEIIPVIAGLAASDTVELETVFSFSLHGGKPRVTPLPGPWDLKR
ncbi:MAG: DUF3343 domain-containing protein [Firmicutes bacterium]|nr:DUF3343 domain-containing protein [Bacillota bacterium]